MSSFSIPGSIAEQDRPTLSFEFFPPKDESGWESFMKSLSVLQGVAPDFVSVTYGAMGSNQDNSLAVVELLAKQVPTIAHLTCIGATRDSITRLLERYQEFQVEGVLALRGDLPAGRTTLPDSEFTYALDLVELVRARTDLEIGVSCFPEKHPESPSLDRDVEILKLKQDAGASFGMTQLFFDVNAYSDIVSRARAAGVTMPIVPGVMPIANSKQVLRMAQMSGAAVPDELEAALLNATDDESAQIIGMEFTVQLVRDLTLIGAPGIHIFTLNQHAAAMELVREAGLA
jgi:methylenetetrahydrofolate reductase (NADPH)